MKVLVITDSLNKDTGWGTYSVNMIEGFKKRGLDVSVVCNSISQNFYDIKQIDLLPGRLSFKRSYLLAWYYAFIVWLKLKKDKDIDVVHCFVESYSFITLWLAIFIRRPYFISVHGSYAVKVMGNFVFGKLQRLAYRMAAKVIAVSEYTKKKVLEWVDLDNMEVIYSGVDLTGIPEVVNNLKKDNLFISVGEVKKRKGYEVVIRAMSLVKDELPDFKYYIIGDNTIYNEYEDYLKRLISDFRLGDRVSILGRVSDDRLKDLYRKAKIFIQTPLDHKKGFAGFELVYLEANGYSVPVIGTNGSGAESAIKNGYSGFLVEQGNYREVAKIVLKLVNDCNLYKEMSCNARKWAEGMSWDDTVVKCENLYKGFIKK